MILLPLFASPTAHAQSNPRPVPRFGVIGAHDDPGAAAELGVGWEQITFEWAAFQPSGPADFVTHSVDPAWLESARDTGREVVGLITSTPDWASESGQPFAVPDGLQLPADDPGSVWAAFVTRLATFYAPQGVHRWVIYQEPDIRHGEGRVQFEGDVADYADLLRIASLAVRAADPQAQIHVAGMNWWADAAAGREPYLARLLAVLGSGANGAREVGEYFDVVTVQVFDNTQAVWDVTIRTRAILDTAGLVDKPIWLVTNAAPTADTPPTGAPDSLFSITPSQQADFVVQAAAMSYALGVERMAVDRLVDASERPPAHSVIGPMVDRLAHPPSVSQPWGLIRADGSRRPAFDAYRTAIDRFSPTTAVQHYSHAAADLIILEQGRRDIYVMWVKVATPVRFVITSGAVGEAAALVNTYRDSGPVSSEAIEYPAAFTLDAPAALPDANGFLTVAGSPLMLVLDHTDFFRVVYLDTAFERIRLK